jgi:hypothetical protein
MAAKTSTSNQGINRQKGDITLMVEVLFFLVYLVIIATLIGIPIWAGAWLLGKYDALVARHHDQDR